MHLYGFLESQNHDSHPSGTVRWGPLRLTAVGIVRPNASPVPS